MSMLDDDQQTEPTPSQLREAAERGAAAQRENERLTRRLALIENGVDPKHPAAEYFLDGYKGDLAPEAIAAAWGQVAPAAAPAPAPAGDEGGTPPPAPAMTTDEQVQAHLRAEEQRFRETLGGGGSGLSEGPGPDPIAAGYEEFHALRKTGKTRQQASKPVIDGIIGAAVAGDSRVLWNGWSEEELQEGS